MRFNRMLYLPATLCAAALALGALAQEKSGSTTPEVPNELVGRWALIASITRGEDVTKRGVTQRGEVSHYIFKADGTFVIQFGETVQETGTWTSDPATSPKVFDHIRNLPTGLGRNIPGIYELGGGVLKICLLPPASRTRPTKCESKAENGSRIYIMKRAAM